MDSVIRGLPITREAHFRLNGVLVTPANPRVTIKDPVGVVMVLDATPTAIAVGIYQYTYTVAINAVLGLWSDEWQGTVSGQPLGPLSEPFEVLPVGYIIPVPSSSFTYNMATDVGHVRLLIDDRDMSNATTAIPLEQRSVIFTDEEIQFFVDHSDGDVFLAAAIGLRTIAANKSLYVLKRTIGRTDVDYGNLRRDLIAQAEAFEKQAREFPADGYAETVWNDFTLRQVLTNQVLRANP